ncbi:radical SAM/SPASM domain-containing protein [Vulcanisaeta souniana]|uniref:Radical SAM/SPASM domain-containing protein n=1 Tax=Vulcanisaeta souniana JCM 11219 TaxID=1293586 RepID=A0A830E682_9CREN|nr:radical SAM protein [Vulcanisaeta souniana]BDR91203.1 radical SAM/SPASM domain-containing protein [Vulcanisaeta souniana JCM 11219]GGI86595.1 radical SAM/SPASM domain-containing protein [Vulcanisaeta souniana JCM 11219]
MINQLEFFLDECPASPLSHILALQGSVEDNNELPYLSMSSINDVTIYLTHACNLECRHCYLLAGKPLSNELGTDDWLLILDKLRDLGAKYVYLLGGEPMLLIRRGLLKIISHAKDLGFYVSMSTNGTLVNRENALQLKRAGLDQVQVSLDGPNPAVNDVIRGFGSFNKAVRAVDMLREVGIAVSLSYTVIPGNAYYVVDMVRLTERLGVPVLTFIRVQEFGRARENGLSLSNELARMVINDLMRIKTRVKLVLNGFRFSLSDLYNAYKRSKEKLNALRIINYSTCPAGRSRFVIDSDGSIYGCELAMNKEFYEGNALRDDLKVIWRNGFRSFRNRNYVSIKPCSTCPMADLCNAGCPARAFTAFGSVNSPDPYCPIVGRLINKSR